MLETKGLYKVYKPKKGVPVTALSDVNITFPHKGMVFLLGKSGSGKSTLLNVLGGLDQYTEGEIIIKGVSSKSFKQKHFDSYRNTYVGFIFQEYNVLEEFTVGANIALALQLQGKKATDEEIGRILEEVDLAGFGARRPNELSGGQKQRVAIARALVKNPEIIMADEPTGALDSATGRQVLETLKRLSEKHLVIVVSHDREFAESYADRIIELADGRVIRDVERVASELPPETPLIYEENGIRVQAGYQLTEEDRAAINAYLAQKEESVILHRDFSHGNAVFKKTDPSKISHKNSASFRLIKSKLPLKNAFKIGGSSLKYKKFRLVMTILLSCVAFGLFGLSDTFGAYHHVNTCTESMIDSQISYTSIRKSILRGEGENAYWNDYGYTLTEKDLTAFELETGVHLKGVYDPLTGMSFEHHLNPKAELNKSDVSLYATTLNGFAGITDDDLAAMNFPLIAGRLPQGKNGEIAISRYVAESFLRGQYGDGNGYRTITEPKELIGLSLTVDEATYTIVGIVDTRLDLERYAVLGEEPEHLSTAEELVRYALTHEFTYASNYSLARVAMVSPEQLEQIMSEALPLRETSSGHLSIYNQELYIQSDMVGKLEDLAHRVTWIDGKARERLAENEIVISSNQLMNYEGAFGQTPEEVLENMQALEGYAYFYDGENARELGRDIRIVGVVELKENEEAFFTLVNDQLYADLVKGSEGPFSHAVGGMPAQKAEIREMVAYCYNEEGGIRFPLQNSVTYELDTVHEVLQRMAKIFLYVGLGFALFAALMLSNFIATSISYKKQEIGILRAIGSRSSDVFRIFFSESFIIAMINFVLSSLGVLAATVLVNYILRHNAGILITVLTFSPRQVLLLFGVSLLVAAVASFLPVRRIAKKRPIDAIRNR